MKSGTMHLRCQTPFYTIVLVIQSYSYTCLTILNLICIAQERSWF